MSLAQIKSTGDLEGLLPIGVSTTSMLAYYPLNGITDVKDYVNGLDGTVGGGISAVDRYGRANKAIYYNGNEAGVTIPITSTAGTYSFSCWVNMESDISAILFDTQSGRMILYYNSGGYITFYDGAARYFSIASIYGSWTHVGLTINNSTKKARLYINGIFRSEVTFVNALDIGGTVKIGSRYAVLGSDWYNVKGSISEFAIWERIITDSEITAMYSGQKAEFSEISYNGNFDGLGNYINMGFKPVDITVDKPFEVEFKHTTALTQRYFSSYNGSDVFQLITSPTNAGYLRVYYSDLSYEEFNTTDIGTYSLGWMKLSITNNGDGSYVIKLFGRNIDNSYTQISTTRTSVIANLPDVNIVLCALNNSGVISAYDDLKIACVKGNGQTWYINNGTGKTITGSLGTVLTVNGTLTNFWQMSEIWNEDANLKMYNTGLVKCKEFIEDNTITEQMKLYSDSVKVKNEFVEI